MEVLYVLVPRIVWPLIAINKNSACKILPNLRECIATFMKGVSPSDSSLHEKSEVFGFAIHIPTGVNTTPVQ